MVPLATGTYRAKDYADPLEHLACTVPGAILGLCRAPRENGSWPLDRVLQTVIRISGEGWRVRQEQWKHE